ncbi:MAG: hypothetical protein ACRC33_08595 [Gemmataceae bacterium]
MPVAKAIPIFLLIVLVLATGVFFFVPATRPAMVDRWFKAARGYSPAKSAEDAMDQFKRAIERRDYDVASDYLTGDYREFFVKGTADAQVLARETTDMASVMKSTGVKSDKVDLMLFWLDPFPAFKYTVQKSSGGSTLAQIHWNEDALRLRDGFSKVSVEENRRHFLMFHSLLPNGTAIPAPITVAVKEVGGAWKIEIPVQLFADRHLRDTVEALRKNGTNYRNAIADVKNNIKNNPAVKEAFESEFKTNLDRAN